MLSEREGGKERTEERKAKMRGGINVYGAVKGGMRRERWRTKEAAKHRAQYELV